jgi:triacylglycerol lipase
MPNGDVLTPREASLIATNAYFTLKDWINKEPKPGVESTATVHNRVLGPGDKGTAAHPDTSLRTTGLGSAQLAGVHEAQTGFGTSSGFGYTLQYEAAGKKHIIIAARGTRPEMSGVPDIITDLRGALTNFGSYGPVHKGFKKTFDSLLPSLERHRALFDNASAIHCVGHSLGGGVATLVAAHYAAAGRPVKLYTFGSPRVGCLDTYAKLEAGIGADNIHRVAHDLDPITLIAPYPYIHVQPSPGNPNNFTLLSPTGRLLSTANHDMAQYIGSVGDLSWSGVRAMSRLVDHDNSLVSRWLLHQDNGASWVRTASARTLSLLFKLFDHLLKQISTALTLGLTAVDLLAEILLKGLNRAREFGERVYQLLTYAASWAGITVAKTADFTASIIRAILNRMLDSIREMAVAAFAAITHNIRPMAIGIAGAWALSGGLAL